MPRARPPANVRPCGEAPRGGRKRRPRFPAAESEPICSVLRTAYAAVSGPRTAPIEPVRAAGENGVGRDEIFRENRL